MGDTGLMTAGMCSVTYRHLPADRIIELAVGAGLERIEWGQDAHIPLGGEAEAHRVGEATRAAGLTVSSLGSYYRAGEIDDLEEDRRVWRRVLAAARALGAPRVRVWAGKTGSASVTPAERRRTLDALKRCVDTAGDVVVATEFHDGTLTDDAVSARAMLDEVPGLRTYWQPPNGMPDGEALQGLRTVLDRLEAVHVFSWWPTPRQRWPLDHREGLWRAVMDVVASTGRPIDALLEFVPGDDPAVLGREAATLRRYLRRAAA
ncbi:sugar phosphate isomerase/epimerase family protein [Thermostaphylospora chromogena]|uniref:Sugar phosphate isomerase/epimerase n=1 Tax=Thermostaphylospora chromogena TaxID=35622 RepID=A0A1H1H6E5_9ACTN|nr:TIM barrel protein [Thermostaphylospora chromogena]SDR20666.1 Sugar phosphate isomerase/epimerase [Thermostaphylospora chromogena]